MSRTGPLLSSLISDASTNTLFLPFLPSDLLFHSQGCRRRCFPSCVGRAGGVHLRTPTRSPLGNTGLQYVPGVKTNHFMQQSAGQNACSCHSGVIWKSDVSDFFLMFAWFLVFDDASPLSLGCCLNLGKKKSDLIALQNFSWKRFILFCGYIK